MRVFEKLAEYRYEQLVFCHDKATGLRAIVAIRHHARPGSRRMQDVPLRQRGRSHRLTYYAWREDDLQGRRERPQPRGGKSVIIGDPHGQVRGALPLVRALHRDPWRTLHRGRGRWHTRRRTLTFIRVETSHVVGVDVTRGGSGHPPLTPSESCRVCGPASRRSSARPHWKAGSSLYRAWGTSAACRLLHEEVRTIVTDVHEAAVERVVKEFGAKVGRTR